MANRLFLPSLTPSARAADPAWNAKLSAKDELGELERAEKAHKDSVRLDAFHSLSVVQLTLFRQLMTVRYTKPAKPIIGLPRQAAPEEVGAVNRVGSFVESSYASFVAFYSRNRKNPRLHLMPVTMPCLMLTRNWSD